MPILGTVASQITGRLTPPDTGAMFPLGMVQVGSGGAASIDFTSIPSTYKHLQIRGIGRNTASGGAAAQENLRMRVNGTTSSNYAWHWLIGDGASASATGTTDSNAFVGFIAQANAAANVYGAFVIDILDYANTSKNKTFRTLDGMDRSGAGYVGLFSGLYSLNTNAISSINLYPEAGTFAQFSSFALYGIK